MARILVVDDEKVMVKGIRFNLENEGYTVDVGYNGRQAVELARANEYDLIILDLMMPELDGVAGLHGDPGILHRPHHYAHRPGGGHGQAPGV